MILELDCGNSFIKWRVLDSLTAVRALAGGVVGDDQALLSALSERFAGGISRCRLVSVRSEEETAALVRLLQERFAMVCQMARPAQQLAGVVNGYEDHQRLGLDRWLALVGAYSVTRGPCLVLDLGTAVTSDFVARDGAHLGGFICPGVPLMRSQLRTHTRRIRYDDDVAERAQRSLEPGRSTAEAVERGCLLMLQGFVNTQVELARERLGQDVDVFLTGGDAPLAAAWLPSARLVPDLVFLGLAIACPFTEG